MAKNGNETRKSAKSTSSTFKLEKIERIILYVRDTERSTNFYSKVLGIPVLYQERGWVELGTRGTVLCLHGGRKARTNEDNAKVSFKVPNFAAAYKALRVREVEALTAPFSPCNTVQCASFRDPDGNVISIEG